MNKDLLKAVTIAAFFHDLGKFAERAYAVEPGEKDEVKQDYRYAHAYHTELALKNLFPDERLTKQLSEDSPECTLLNLAVRHHKPRTDLELIIAEGDRIASGHERSTGDDTSDWDSGARERKSRTPMVSVLSRIRLKQYVDDKANDWRYLINRAAMAHSENFSQIFPVKGKEYTPDSVQKDYKKHWEEFCDAVKGCDIYDHFPTLLEISRDFQWCLPATTRKQDLADSSLFDHQKASAALSACLFSFHSTDLKLDSGSKTNESAIMDRKQRKFLLFCGDISGIQKFIYQISSKGAYKTLKGKSFFIQLLAEILADEYINHFNLTPANILYASGDKFYLLLPNTKEVEKKIESVTEEINRDLFDSYEGNLFIRTGAVALSADDLRGKSDYTLYKAWDELTRKLVFEDRNRYHSMAVSDYDRLFGVEQLKEFSSCQVCHSTMVQHDNKKDKKICRSCMEMEKIGRKLPDTGYIVFSGKSETLQERYLMKIRDRYIWFLSKLPESLPTSNAGILAINDPDFHKIPDRYPYPSIVNSRAFIAGSNHKFREEFFDDIAKKSKGLKRLGILRMDVDNLGKIFSEGLENYKNETIKDSEKFHSLGRITTMSWQLSLFFGAVLPGLVSSKSDWKERATVVYSGGDDLFLLGAWDCLPAIAMKIRENFHAFACENRSFSLSGGMVMTGGKFPVYKSAQMAGDAEEKAKGNETFFSDNMKPDAKNSFTLFNTPMHWKEFKEISSIRDELMDLLKDRKNYPLLCRLRDIGASWHTSHEELKRKDSRKIFIADIEQRLMAEKWRWRMVYTLARFCEGHGSIENFIKKLQEMIVNPVADTRRQGIELLSLLARWCELELRNEGKET